MRNLSLISFLLVLTISLTPAHALQPTLTLTSPVPFQTFQHQSGAADIPIEGQVDAEGTIEARFNGGEWQSVAPIHSGAFSGVLPAQAGGQGGLEIRIAQAPEIVFGVPYVGIGDVFVVAGQSNAGGYGETLHITAHDWLTGTTFANDYAWHQLSDPFDSDTNQIDAVSRDWSTGGSAWALVATHLMNARSIPAAFVPSPKSGSSIDQWLPASDPFDRSTLYGSMAHRARLTGARAVLWWQGESDALGGMSETDYQARLEQLASAVERDLGIPLIACLIHNSRDIPDENEAAIRRAVVAAASAHGNILLGPDLSDLISDDQYHLRSDGNIEAAAERWWQALSGIV